MAEDFPILRELLRAEGLPTEGRGFERTDFLVMDDAGRVCGCGGIEGYGDVGLLRSLAVVPDQRGRGFGLALARRLVSWAAEHGLRELYLLTETAAPFFERKLGFDVIAREEAPPEIRATDEFARQCPGSAVLMRQRLDHRSRLAKALAGR
jgi:amino-acid N-acetyltransferase